MRMFTLFGVPVMTDLNELEALEPYFPAMVRERQSLESRNVPCGGLTLLRGEVLAFPNEKYADPRVQNQE